MPGRVVVVHVKPIKSLRQLVRDNKILSHDDDLLPTIILPARTRTSTITNDMRTVKLVIIGNSGVGKTSLRGQVRTTFISFGKARLANDPNRSMSLAISRQATVQPSVPTSSPRRYRITPTQKNR